MDKQLLLEIRVVLNGILVKGDDVLRMAEAMVRINKLIKECEEKEE